MMREKRVQSCFSEIDENVCKLRMCEQTFDVLSRRF